MPACQIQSTADHKRVLGTCLHTPAGKGGPETSTVPAPARERRPTLHGPPLRSEGLPSPLLAVDGAGLLQEGRACLPLGGGCSRWKHEPEVQSQPSLFTSECCFCFDDILDLSQKDPPWAPIK